MVVAAPVHAEARERSVGALGLQRERGAPVVNLAAEPIRLLIPAVRKLSECSKSCGAAASGRLRGHPPRGRRGRVGGTRRRDRLLPMLHPPAVEQGRGRTDRPRRDCSTALSQVAGPRSARRRRCRLAVRRRPRAPPVTTVPSKRLRRTDSPGTLQYAVRTGTHAAAGGPVPFPPCLPAGGHGSAHRGQCGRRVRERLRVTERLRAAERHAGDRPARFVLRRGSCRWRPDRALRRPPVGDVRHRPGPRPPARCVRRAARPTRGGRDRGTGRPRAGPCSARSTRLRRSALFGLPPPATTLCDDS